MPVLDTTILFAILGAIIVAQQFFLARTHKDIRDMISPDALRVIRAILVGAEGLASQTPTTLDDEVITKLKEQFGEVIQQQVKEAVLAAKYNTLDPHG